MDEVLDTVVDRIVKTVNLDKIILFWVQKQEDRIVIMISWCGRKISRCPGLSSIRILLPRIGAPSLPRRGLPFRV